MNHGVSWKQPQSSSVDLSPSSSERLQKHRSTAGFTASTCSFLLPSVTTVTAFPFSRVAPSWRRLWRGERGRSPAGEEEEAEPCAGAARTRRQAAPYGEAYRCCWQGGRAAGGGDVHVCSAARDEGPGSAGGGGRKSLQAPS